MDGPCVGPSGPKAFWAFVLLAILSHARGTVLLMREALSWLKDRRGRRAYRRTPNK